MLGLFSPKPKVAIEPTPSDIAIALPAAAYPNMIDLDGELGGPGGFGWMTEDGGYVGAPLPINTVEAVNAFERPISAPARVNASRRSFLIGIGAVSATALFSAMPKNASAATDAATAKKMEVGTQGMAEYDKEAARNKFINNPEKGVIKDHFEAEAKFKKGEYHYYYPESVLDPKRKSLFQIEREVLAKDPKNNILKINNRVALEDGGKGKEIMKDIYVTKEEADSAIEVKGNGLIVYAEVVGGKGYAVLPPGTMLITQSIGEYKGSQVILGCMNPIIVRAQGDCQPPCIDQN
jgi:hypothetical protein